MSPLAWAAFVLAGAIGAPARYVLDGTLQDRSSGAFPWGTLVVNATGSLLLGFLTGLGLYHGLTGTTRLVAGTGFCGAFTTFSTFSYETVRLIEEGAHSAALRNIAGTVLVGAIAASAGMATAALI